MLNKSQKDSSRKLHLGCGLHVVQGWINVDGSWNAWVSQMPLARYILASLGLISKEQVKVPWSRDIMIHDLRKTLPFAQESVSCIYSSHVFEHLYLEESRRLMRECFRVLHKGGVLRIVVPDLKALIHEYLGDNPFLLSDRERISELPAERLNRRLCFWPSAPLKSSFIFKIYNTLNDFHVHKWVYDADSLRKLFEESGFQDIEQKKPFDSKVEGIRQIEIPDRIQNGAGICMEGVKG